jgi:hypothetical protein
MESEESKKPRRTILWIGLACLCAVAAAVFWSSREPLPAYPFLKHFPIVEWRKSAEPGIRVAILKGDSEAVWKDAEGELSGKMMFNSSGMSNIDGVVLNYHSTQTENGVIKVSNDLNFAEGSGFPELKNGYCAVAFTRPKSLLDRAVESIKKLMGIKEPDPNPQIDQMPLAPSPPGSGPMMHV